jgi:hypothetical protein
MLLNCFVLPSWRYTCLRSGAYLPLVCV